MAEIILSEVAIAKKHWRTTVPGLCCIGAGLFDLVNTGSLNANNLACFAAGWGLIKAADAGAKEK